VAVASRVVQAGEVRSARIESLRAIAALGVLAGHAYLVTEGVNPTGFGARLLYGGGLGVYLFFALTGYLLYWPFARRTFGDGRPISIAGYARNRALRILPLYYVVLIVLLLVNEGGGSFTEWWRFATFTQSFFPDTITKVDGPMWSIVVELQFYALLPLLAWGVARIAGKSPAKAGAVLLALGAASLAIWWAKVHHIVGADLRWRYSLPVTLLNFVPGMLLALVRLELERRPRGRLPSSTVLIGAGVALWAASTQRISLSGPICAGAAFLVLAGVVLPVRSGRLARALDLRALGLVGLVSYSVYLWHLPILDSLERHTSLGLVGLLAAGVSICLGVSGASYIVVERPFLRLRKRWGSTIAGQVDPGSSERPPAEDRVPDPVAP
jgi:peptidoglycan/LPS O-acetylase OafA/YrhL